MNKILVALLLLFFGGVGAEQCHCEQHRNILVILDVSWSIKRKDIFSHHLPMIHNTWKDLGPLDKIGLMTMGEKTTMNIPIGNHSKEEWDNYFETFVKSNKRATGYWGRRCCTPVATALDMAIDVFDAADEVDNFVLFISDGRPWQNHKMRKGQHNDWSLQTFYSSQYRTQLIPDLAMSLKEDFGVHLSLVLIDNSEGHESSNQASYWKGTNITFESSRLRRKGRKKRRYKGPVMTHEARNFPIISEPSDDHILRVRTVDNVDESSSVLTDALCQQTTCPPTVAPTTSPTEVVTTCRGAKDLIFLVDASNSVSFRENGKPNRFRDFVLALPDNLQRVQTEGKADVRTALITFSEKIVTQIPLRQWDYNEFSDEIQIIRNNAANIVSCCTPLPEAFLAAKDIVQARTEYTDNEVIVLVLSDGMPFPNHDQNENFEEYMSSALFREAEKLNSLPNVTSLFVGFANKHGVPPMIDYFIGDETGVTSCQRKGGNSKACDFDCLADGNDVCSDASVERCWVTGARDRNCTTGFYPPIVKRAISSGSEDVGEILRVVQDLLCNA